MTLTEAQKGASDAVAEHPVVELVQQLISTPGVSGQEQDIVQVLVARLRDRGWREIATIGEANVFAVLGDGPVAVLYTVYVDSPPAGAMTDPYTPRLIEGHRYGKRGPVIRGRGACTKGTLAAMITGAEAARVAGGLRERSVAFAATTHNEVGIAEVVRRTGLRRLGAIVGEPTGNSIGIRARGITWLDVVITGRPTHAGIPAGRVNPIEQLAEVLPALHSIALPSRADMPPASLTPIAVSHTGAPPRTPYDVRLRLDRRTLPGETTESVCGQVRDALDRIAERDPDLRATVSVVDSMQPFEADTDSGIARALAVALRETSGRDAEYMTVPFGTNAGYLQRNGVPAVTFGPALIADRGDEEHVEVAATLVAARTFACVALAEELTPRSR